MKRGMLIAGNWKMNHSPSKTEEFFQAVGSLWNDKISAPTQEAISQGRLQICVCPPALSFHAAIGSRGNLPIEIGSQNTHLEKAGAFHGEISAPMLTEIGIRISLTGHSERRQYFGESDEVVRQRTLGLLNQGLQVIFCLGETLAERKTNQTEAVLLRQLESVLGSREQGAAQFLDGSLVVAYEPVWAIGTGLTASPEQAEAAHRFIRSFIEERFGSQAAEKTLILYGGSVNPENISSLLACPDVDGALVGGASLKPDSFLSLVEAGGNALAL